MKLAIMQPYIFPYIGYFQLINAADKFVILDDVSFIKKGWINRNKIKVNNREYTFTIPLKKSSQNKLIKDIEISDGNKWRDKFLKTIERSYKKSPFYKEIFGLITKIVLLNENSITQLNYDGIIEINKYLGIKKEIIISSVKYKNINLIGEDRILDICRIEKSLEYINPVGGLKLYSKNKFSLNGVKLRFLKPNEIIYTQFGSSFIPYLSIIDVLMNNSKDSVENYLYDYVFV